LWRRYSNEGRSKGGIDNNGAVFVRQKDMQEKPTYKVVGAVVMDRGEVLAVQKGQTKYAYTSYHWEYPGGKVEPGETEPEALKRELMEEMDYPIRVMGLLGEVEHEYPDFRVELRFYLCEPQDREHPRQFTLREHADYRWIRPERIPELPWCEADDYLFASPEVVDLLDGTPFQKAVWRALCAIPRGETRTYQEIAAAVGRSKAVRAVANAIHANPLPYFVPCHRVVPKTGGVGGYAYGSEVKAWLLAAEK